MRKLDSLNPKKNTENLVSKEKPGPQSTGVYAAALQDHLIRNSNIKFLNKLTKPVQTKKTSNVQKIFSQGRVISLDHNKILNDITKKENKTKTKTPNILMEYEATLKKAEADEQQNIQSKLYKYISKLTLAQRLGLVQKPPQPLSKNEWSDIEEKSKKREGDHSCPICLESFTTPNNQTILSCSHVFHKTCLSNFERFTKQRVCPICRRQDYEKKNFDQGFINHLTKQIIRIQKSVRGFLLRRRLYAELNKTYKATSTLFRRRLLAYKLQLLNEKMSKKTRVRQKETEKLISEIDKNLDEKNNMDSKLLEIHNLHRLTQENIRAALPGNTLIQQTGDSQNLIQEAKPENKGEMSAEWKETLKKAVLRNEQNCAICFNDLNNGKKLCLLNCTHLFHSACLLSFEYYALLNQHNCPVCRCDYKKIEIDHW